MLEKLLDNKKLTWDEEWNIRNEIKTMMTTNLEYLISIYNKMSKEQILNCFCNGSIPLNLFINQKVLASIEDKSKFVILFPYINVINFEGLDKEAQKFLLSHDEFYLSKSIDMGIIKSCCNDDLVKLFISNMIKYQPVIFASFLDLNKKDDEIIKYRDLIDREVIAFLHTCEYSDQVLKLFSVLSDEVKNEVFKSEWFKSKVDIRKNRIEILDFATEEMMDEMIKTNIVSSDYLLDAYIFHKNIMFFNKYIELEDEIDNMRFFENMDIILSIDENSFSKIKSKDKLFWLIDNIDDTRFIKSYFSKYRESKNQSKELSSFLRSKAVNILSQKKVFIDELSNYFLNSNDPDLFQLIIANISKEDLLLLSVRYEAYNNYVMDLLHNNPNYFENIDVNNNIKYKCPKLSDEHLQKYFNVAPYLNKDQLSIYFDPVYIDMFENIKTLYIETLKSNPDKLVRLSDAIYMQPDVLNHVFSNILIDRFIYLCYHTKHIMPKEQNEMIQNVMHDRLMEIAEFFNEERAFVLLDALTIFKFLKVEDYEIFLNSLESDFYIDRFEMDAHFSTNKYLKKLIIDCIIDRCNDDNYQMKCLNPTILYEYQDSISFNILLSKAIYIFNYKDSNNTDYTKLMNMILQKIDNDISVLFDISIICKLDEVLTYLPDEYKERITNYIDEKYNKLKDKYPMLEEYVNCYTDKANYVLSVENNYINNDNISKVTELLDKNKYLFNSMDFRLLTKDVSRLGDYFIDKTSRYQKIASKVYKIYKENQNNFELLICLSNKIRKENNDFLYDKKIEIIIDYLSKNSINVSEINDNVLTNIESYILENCILKEQNKDVTNIENFIEEKNNAIDDKIQKCDDLNKLKDLVNRKHFGLNTILINQFLHEYATNYNLVSSYSTNDIPEKYIELIKNVNSIQSLEELKTIEKSLPLWNISHNLIVTSIMIDAYNESITNV